MGVPVPGMDPAANPVEDDSAEALLSSLRTIAAAERRKHASVYNYWLSIRGTREFPPIHDLDPLEISDAGAFSILLEMIGGGEDAEIRHLGQAIRGGINPERVSDAPNPSLLSAIATRLPVVAACRDAFAFEDEFETAEGKTRCWVSLLPFSVTGTWIDFVYGFVSLDDGSAEKHSREVADAIEEAVGPREEPAGDGAPTKGVEPALEETAQAVEEEVATQTEAEPLEDAARSQPPDELAHPQIVQEPGEFEQRADPELAPIPIEPEPSVKPGFSKKFFDTLASVKGFYGNPVEVELDPETVAFEAGEVTDWDAAQTEAEVESRNEPAGEAQSEPEIEAMPEAEPQPGTDLHPEVEPAPRAELGPQSDFHAEVEPGLQAGFEPQAEFDPQISPEPSNPPSSTLEGTLESKLSDVRAKADEARQAKLRANAALYEGLSAAYDFALDAEGSPEEYLKLIQAEGLKIQLRSPMKPVAKLAFDGMCDEGTIKQLEAILAWAFEEELPRGTLADRIEAEGGLAPILNRESKAA